MFNSTLFEFGAKRHFYGVSNGDTKSLYGIIEYPNDIIKTSVYTSGVYVEGTRKLGYKSIELKIC